ncbi:MAG: universal stress protein [Nitrospiraceae bacterium]|nr:universal stress protein [Nitrospiraceae bacterium]
MQSKLCPISNLDSMLLATDGSAASETAIREAMGLAKACSAKLYVLSVVEVNDELASMAPQVVEKMSDDARLHVESVKANAQFAGIDCEAIVHTSDDPYRIIVDEAEKRGVGMIVMGRHGKKGFKRLITGSVTAKVITHAPCSVLVVKA